MSSNGFLGEAYNLARQSLGYSSNRDFSATDSTVINGEGGGAYKGGSGDDTFNLTGNKRSTLDGAGGNDTFNINTQNGSHILTDSQGKNTYNLGGENNRVFVDGSGADKTTVNVEPGKKNDINIAGPADINLKGEGWTQVPNKKGETGFNYRNNQSGSSVFSEASEAKLPQPKPKAQPKPQK